MALLEKFLRRDLRVFIGVGLLLSLLGLIFIYSASSVYALERFGSAHYFFKRQFIYFVVSLGAFCFFALVPLPLWRKYTPYFFFGSLLLTMLTFIPQFSSKIHGSSRWLHVAGISLQPSELLKVFLFMYIGLFLERKRHKIFSFVHGYLPFLIILGVVFGVLLKQPDFGSVVTIFATIIAVLFVAEFKMVYLGVTLLCALPAMVYLIVAKAYRLHRILIFLNPWTDPQGRGFQIIQSLIAISSGHWFGLGIANSKQKYFYLPMQHTDFIFPIIAEETGFFGVMLLLMCYFIFFWYGMRVALRLSSLFAFFTTISFVIFISLQVMVNLMVALGLVPTKGLGLPFISYGGTALMSVFCMLGLIVNFAKESRDT